jgi:hypothetical protein
MSNQPPLGNQPQEEGPERFDPELLTQPAAVRLAWFEKECLIEHARLDQACSAILQVICSPGEGAGFNRLGTMVLVIGPARVGKTTLIKDLKKRLLERAKERMMHDPSHLPFVSVSAPESGRGRFNWVDYYTAVLREVNYPFLKHEKVGVRVRDFREAMEEALIQHQPYAVIVDEAHCPLPECLALPLIKCVCLLRQGRYFSDTLSSMSWYALFLWKEELTDELCRYEGTCLLFCFTGEHGHYLCSSHGTDPDHRPRLF